MLSLLINKFKKVLMVLLVGMLLMGGLKTVEAETEYVNYSIGGITISSTVDEEQSIPAWAIREYDVIVRVGEYNNKSGKRIYIDNFDIRWKDIPTDIPIHRDSEGHYIHEHDINLKIATKLYNELRANGINAKLQVANSRAEDLNAAARISNKSNPKLYVSIHHNYFDENSKGYFGMYNEGNEIAKNIAQRLSDSIKDNGLVRQNPNRANDGYIGELNKIHNSTVGVLMELGFFSNPNELMNIISDEYANYVGEHMANEIQNVLNDFWK